MLVYFSTKKMQKTCNSEKAMRAEYGEKRAKKLKQRLAELGAAETLADISHLPPARCHELAGDRTGQLSLDLDHPYRLILVPGHEPVPTKPDGGLDWEAVTAVEVIEIADTH